MAEVHVHSNNGPNDEYLDLLSEWLGWWARENAVGKAPAALHTRTAVALSTAGRDVQALMP